MFFLRYDIVMDINLLQVLILFAVGGLLAGGVLNTLAGGGSFLTVPPVLIFTG